MTTLDILEQTQRKYITMQACDRYSAAWKIKQSSHSALYNWGVALSDMSRVLKATDRAAANALLTDAAEKYATSLQWNANNPQAMPEPPLQNVSQCMRSIDGVRRGQSSMSFYESGTGINF